jgi:hypothetical protein
VNLCRKARIKLKTVGRIGHIKFGFCERFAAVPNFKFCKKFGFRANRICKL